MTVVIASSPEQRALPRSMSERIFQVQWDRSLPWRFEDVVVQRGSFEDARAFMALHYESMFGGGGDTRFFRESASAAKSRFGDELDTFVVRDSDVVVGLLLGHPTDWSSYYMRSCALLPAYRSRGLLGDIIRKFYEPLARAGVDRIEGECAPTNSAMMRTLTKLGWLATSTSLSERWGTTVRFTKFLHDRAEAAFVRQFCMTAESSSAGTKKGANQ